MNAIPFSEITSRELLMPLYQVLEAYACCLVVMLIVIVIAVIAGVVTIIKRRRAK